MTIGIACNVGPAQPTEMLSANFALHVVAALRLLHRHAAHPIRARLVLLGLVFAPLGKFEVEAGALVHRTFALKANKLIALSALGL